MGEYPNMMNDFGILDGYLFILFELSSLLSSTQNFFVFGQVIKRWSIVSSSSPQKLHRGDWSALNFETDLFVVSIRFTIRNWNHFSRVQFKCLFILQYISSQFMLRWPSVSHLVCIFTGEYFVNIRR